MLYKLRFRGPIAGVREELIEAVNQIEAEWRGHAYCEREQFRFVSVAKAVVADETTDPMPKEVDLKKMSRVGA